MTREDIDNIISVICPNDEDFEKACISPAYLKKELETLALEQELCIDAISREELLKAIDTWDKFGYTETGCFVREPKGDYVPYIHYDDVINCIKGMPPVNPAEKVGQWIDIQYFKADDTYYRPKCPFCSIEPKEYSNYCPNCGAKMSASPTGAEGSEKK